MAFHSFAPALLSSASPYMLTLYITSTLGPFYFLHYKAFVAPQMGSPDHPNSSWLGPLPLLLQTFILLSSRQGGYPGPGSLCCTHPFIQRITFGLVPWMRDLHFLKAELCLLVQRFSSGASQVEHLLCKSKHLAAEVGVSRVGEVFVR